MEKERERARGVGVGHEIESGCVFVCERGAQEVVLFHCRRHGFSDAAGRAFIARLREEALATGPAAAGAGLEERVMEMLRDIPRYLPPSLSLSLFLPLPAPPLPSPPLPPPSSFRPLSLLRFL